MTTTITNPPTEKQVNFARKLVAERDMSEGRHEDWRTARKTQVDAFEDHLNGFTKRTLSQFIDGLLSYPRFPSDDEPTARPQTVIEEDGMYVLDGTIYKVQRAVHGSGNLYAKELVPPDEFGDTATLQYAPGIVRRLTPEHKLTKEQAQSFGALYGTCCRCGRTLTAEDSIDRMMGPVCFGKMGW